MAVDPSLFCALNAASKQPTTLEGQQDFFFSIEKELLYWWVGFNSQLVIHQPLHAWLMHLVHDPPLMGHQAVEKTLTHLSQQFFTNWAVVLYALPQMPADPTPDTKWGAPTTNAYLHCAA